MSNTIIKDEVLPESKKDRDAIMAMLKNEPEVTAKVDYYKGLLKAQVMLIDSIESKINRDREITIMKLFGFIPIVRVQKVSEYEKSKLLIEKIEAENQLYYQKQYFEIWLQRKREYEVYFDKLTAEVNANFDQLYTAAKEVARQNLRLSSAISQYEKSDMKDNQKTKNEFYLYIKQEVRNHAILGKKQVSQ